MPELPDVEGFRMRIDEEAVGRRVEHVHVRDPRCLLDGVTRQGLARALHGRRLAGTRRHGKWLGVALEGDSWLVLHFGMTGEPVVRGPGASVPRHTRVLFDLDDGSHLAWVCQRRLGRVGWTGDFDAFVESRGLGPDAVDVGPARLRRAIRGRRTTVKSLLLDQGALAGVGNIWADEVLFQAGLRPSRRVDRLGEDEVRRLGRALRRVLRLGASRGGDPERLPSGWLRGRREEREPRCPRCHAPLRRETVAGRTAVYCPHCQR